MYDKLLLGNDEELADFQRAEIDGKILQRRGNRRAEFEQMLVPYCAMLLSAMMESCILEKTPERGTRNRFPCGNTLHKSVELHHTAYVSCLGTGKR